MPENSSDLVEPQRELTSLYLVESDSVENRPIPIWQAVLRWIFFLPFAIVIGVLANAAVRLVNYVTMVGWFGMRPDSIQQLVVKHILSNVILGAAIVYAGSRFAPSHRKIVAYSLTVLTILLGGMSLFVSIVDRKGWEIAGCVAMAIGSGMVAHSVATGDLDLDTHKLQE